MRSRKYSFLTALIIALGCAACGGGGDNGDNGNGGNDNGTPMGPGDNTGGAGKPASLPAFSSLSLYSADSPFNTKIGPNPAIDPNSDTLVGSLNRDLAGAFAIQVKQFSTPVYFADANTPKVDVFLTCGVDFEVGVNTLKNVPIPDFAEPALDVDGADNPPVGCGTEADQDNNMVIFDLSTRCEYDFWQVRKENGKWVASWGNRISLDSDGIYAKGFSTRGSGFAFPAGMIWPDELKNGRINHALVVDYPFTKAGGPVAPAPDSDGITSRADAIPEGARLQLNPDLDLDTLSLLPYEKTIAKALQEYGMFMADTGGPAGTGTSLYAVDPKSVEGNPYAGVLPDVDFPDLPNIPIDQFRVLKLPPQDPNFQSKLKLVDDACAVFQ